MKRIVLIIPTVVTALVLSPGAPSVTSLTAFKSCTAMHRVYAHGVGRWGARDKTSGTPVTNFKRSNRL